MRDAVRFFSGAPGAVHFVGIAGIGMAGLAILLKNRGWNVSGCDLKHGRLMDWLEEHGARCNHGHDPAHIKQGFAAVIRSAAIPESNPELKRARRLGVPIFRRGEVLAALVSTAPSIAVAGTHGKTTTTALIAHILTQAGFDPCFAVGGETPQLGSVAGRGTGKWLVVEADESDGTLAMYAPEISVITNMEFDHAENYADFDAVAACFRKFAVQTRGLLVFGGDCHASAQIARIARRAMSAGIGAGAEWQASRLRRSGVTYSFEVRHCGRSMGRVKLRIPGLHNVRNALVAAAAACAAGVKWPGIAHALCSFQGVSRRFERIADFDSIAIYSDYSHHPTEISALAATAALIRAKRRPAVFQPHRHSRTRALCAGFASPFDGFEPMLLLPVHAASEQPEPGGTTGDLYAMLRQHRINPPIMVSSAKSASAYLRRLLKPGDALFAIGAGDEVDAVARAVANALKECGASKIDPAPRWAESIRALGLSQGTVCRINEPLARRTTFGLGGNADIFVACAMESDVIRLRKWCIANDAPLTILGAGSNVLVSDAGVRGVIARLVGPGFGRMQRKDSCTVFAGAGAPLARLVDWTARRGLAGMEFLAGIPGTVGGALRMNAGAHGSEIGDHTIRVRFIDPNGVIKIADGKDIGFSYRNSRELDGCVALSAEFAVSRSTVTRVRSRVRNIVERRAWMTGLRCAGSIFKNSSSHGPTGALLDQLGFKGRSIGGARVNERHANIIEAAKNATASDVLALVEQIKVEVYSRAGLALQEEVVHLE